LSAEIYERNNSAASTAIATTITTTTTTTTTTTNNNNNNNVNHFPYQLTLPREGVQNQNVFNSPVKRENGCIKILFNPLNAELNPIFHFPVLLGDLTFMGPCIVSIFRYISNKMQCYTVYLYLETALRHPQHTQTSTISSTIAADSSNGVTNTRCCRYSCMRS
jgi:hypothetical protein